MHTCSFALTTVSITWPCFHDRFLFGSHHFAPCKGIQDRFWILRCGFKVAGLYTGFQCLSIEIGIWIPIVSGIPDSVELYSGFHTQKFPGFRIPHAKKFPDSGIRIPLHGANHLRNQRNLRSEIFYVQLSENFMFASCVNDSWPPMNGNSTFT